jgi:predicted GIY-YIG superfamily endonuclease
MYKLYWIKSENQKDPLAEGYIGITSQSIQKRFNDHKYNNKNKHLKNRCLTKDVEIVCLLDNLGKEEARHQEFLYRPKENIGWNINKGGDLPPSRKNKVSPKSLLVGENRTEKQKKGSKKRAEKIKSNNFSGQRKNKVNHSKPCENCGIIFDPKYQTRKKYCCLSCAVEKRNKNEEYLKLLSDKAKSRWSNDNFKKSVSELIKKSLNEKNRN